MKNVFAQDCLRQSKPKLCVFLLSTFLYLSFIQQSNAQWIRMEAIPNAPVMALAVKADRLFAALEDNRIFTTTNAGFTWNALQVSSIATTRLLSLKVIDDNLYVGTFANGVFQSKDNGQTWKNWSNITLPVTDFQKFNGKIYATTLGQGVFVYDAATDSWLAFNNGLPNYSSNVNAIETAANQLVIAAGGNGTCYVYDFIANLWAEKFYYGSLLPGLDVDEMLSVSDTLFVVNRNRILKSRDGGLTWVDDRIGARNGVVRFLHEGFDRLYIITNVLDGGTWIQSRRKGVPTGTTWSVGEEFVPNSFIYDLVEFQGRLFLAREDGIFYKQQIVALEKPEDTGAAISIYPNPIAQGRFNMAGILPIRQVVIYNLWGQVVWKDEIQQAPYEVRAPLGAGMYLLSVLLSDGTTQTRKIVIE